MPLAIPNRYTFLRFGPEGGQATLAFYHDEWLHRDVVIKTARVGVSRYDVLKEIKAIAGVISKYVVEIYDTINDDEGDLAAVVEESVVGEEFGAYVCKKLSNEDRLGLIYQLASALRDMHAADRVHRDLKPKNMIVRKEDGLLKIFDFGISNILEDGSDHTIVGKGSRGYRAPELYATGKKAIDPKMDCYALGVIAHQVFVGGRLDAAFMPMPPDPLAAGLGFQDFKFLSSPLQDALSACLSVAPEARPTALEVRSLVAAELVKGRHQARLGAGDHEYIIDSKNKSVNVKVGTSEVTIAYTGTHFVAEKVVGDIYVNNAPLTSGSTIEGDVVITIGTGQGADRSFFPFDISHPEVVL